MTKPSVDEVEAIAEAAILAAFQAGQQDGMRGYGALPDKEINAKQEATEAALYAMLRSLSVDATQLPPHPPGFDDIWRQMAEYVSLACQQAVAADRAQRAQPQDGD
jgi:hypothetical protein